jgi:ATP-binding cassette subfamily C (CFTR/MRP) protein 1
MEADFICLIREGKIIERGTYEQLMAMKGEIANLIKTVSNQDQSAESETISSGSSTTVDIERSVEDKEKDEMEEAQSHLTELQPIRSTGPGGKKRKGSSGTLRRASAASLKGPRSKLHDEEEPHGKTKQGKEFSEQGKVKWDGKSSGFPKQFLTTDGSSLLGICKN